MLATGVTVPSPKKADIDVYGYRRPIPGGT